MVQGINLFRARVAGTPQIQSDPSRKCFVMVRTWKRMRYNGTLNVREDGGQEERTLSENSSNEGSATINCRCLG